MNDLRVYQRALLRQQHRLAEILQQLAGRDPHSAPDLLHESEELRLMIALLEANMPVAAVSAPTRSVAAFASETPHIVSAKDHKAMVLVPAGTFTLGSSSAYRKQEQPGHAVTLPAFYIDRTPVTIGEYERFVAETGHPAPRVWFSNRRPADYQQHPVTGVSWHDARTYAIWAGKRLPTEAEWEKAAGWDWQNTTKRRYPWGDEWDARRCNVSASGIGHTTPVGAFSPYGDALCGASDMAGNVSEWTASLDWNYPYHPDDGRDDPARYGVRVRRGGSYIAEELFARTITRQLTPGDGLFLDDGFRCVATAGKEMKR